MRKKFEKSTTTLNSGVLTKIEKAKSGKKFNLYIDEVFVFSVFDDTFIKFNLKKNQELSKKNLEEIYNFDQIIKACNSAYNLLAIRPRSEYELKTRLSEKYTPEIINEVLNILNKKHLLSDQEFAKYWKETGNIKLKSKKQIQYELYQKHLNSEQIQEIIDSISIDQEIEKAEKIIKKVEHRFSKLSDIKKKHKLQALLLRKGYTWSVINQIIY